MMQAKGRTAVVSSRLIGYARVSTEEQGTDPQLDELSRRRLRHCARGARLGRRSHAAGAWTPAARDRARRDVGRGPARPPGPLCQPPPRRHRAARDQVRAFPQPARVQNRPSGEGPRRHRRMSFRSKQIRSYRQTSGSI